MVMKKVMFGLLILVLSSFVFAQSSEISTSFNVNGVVDVGRDYVSPLGFWDIYGGYIVGLIIILIVVLVFFKKRSSKVPRPRVSKRKISKRKYKKKK